MVNNKVNWTERIDLAWITTKAIHGITHRSQVDDCWDTREVLKDDSGWEEWDFNIFLRSASPVEDLLNVTLFDAEVIAVTDCGFKQNTNRVRQSLETLVF